MDLSLSEDEVQLISAVSALFKQESSPERVRAVESSGFDPQLWKHLEAFGVPSMAARAADTAAARLFDLALIAEQAGSTLASAPVIEGLVATRLLDRCGEPARELLQGVRSSELMATVSLQAGPAGTPRLVPAGSVSHLVIGLDGDHVVGAVSAPPHTGVENIGNLALAYRDLTSGVRTVLANGPDAARAMAGAQRDWRVLSAAQLVGLSQTALDLGVEYVKSREVFGAPIATFQTIAHRLADDATAIDGARLLAYKAAWATDDGRSSAAALASMAWCFSSETALNVTRDSLHYHGGYGFTREYDIQLYFRRAKAYSLLLGDPRVEYRRLADAAFPHGDAET